MKVGKKNPNIPTKRTDITTLYNNEIIKYSVLTVEEEIELSVKIKEGDFKARQQLARCNLKFVVSIAKQYSNFKVPIDDLIQYGNIGLIKAVDRFDHTKGFKFISYAVWWVRQSIIEGLIEQRLIRLPTNVNSLSMKIFNEMDSYFVLNGYYPNNKELANMFGISEKMVKNILKTNNVASLDSPFGSEDVTLNHFVAGNLKPSNNIKDNDSLNVVNKLLRFLSKRNADIVKMYYGITPYEEAYTKETIASKYNMGDTRIAQIIKESIKILVDKSRGYMKEYL